MLVIMLVIRVLINQQDYIGNSQVVNGHRGALAEIGKKTQHRL